ncbi:response regulator [Pseudovibrio sp. SPO723]|uniref:response regulator n=1 Tax=Nesiotobacter zosterae TaxID=392721 RepID=UPI0029C3BF58|nr:response regulator [Pseudovibrio sp. SPO723]MDX5593208.1 response regulator [Pseudovibrio sp. SPO723]
MIYVIEDDASVRDAISCLFEELGLNTKTYIDGESFFEGSRPKQSDIVFVDLALPGMAGRDIIRKLSAEGGPPQIVAMTGLPRRDLDQIFVDGFVPKIVRKPLEEKSLLQFVPV